MIISIASGKGGTGKTTVAVNLALALALEQPVQLLDCDVEEPNAHLFLKPVLNQTETETTPVPEIDAGKCSYCGQCEELCQFKAIVIAGETILVFPELCHSCGGCMAICPENAIQEAERELGVVQKGVRDNVQLVTGKLRVGEAMSPPLIQKVRSSAATEGLTIIDAPPGTSCPVIAAMRDVDFVVLVTEPTPFGLNDLQLAVGAVRTLNLKHGLVINRSDMGDDRVLKYAEEIGMPVLMEIPFDRRIAEAYSRGDMLIDALPEMKSAFTGLYKKIETLVNEEGGAA